MQILVTGAAGFLGSNLCTRLLDEGHQVIGMDNFITGKRINIAHLAGHHNFNFIRHDVSNYIFVPEKLDAVMHFASPASPNPNSPYGYPNLPIQTMKAGALGTHNTLGVALANNARFMLASTSEIYGDPQVHPQTEDYWGHVNPIGERSVYDEAKRFAEALTMAYHRFHDVNTCIARIFNVYGEKMHIDDGRAIPNFINQALSGEPLTVYGDGSQTRSFVYVDDEIDGFIRLLMSDEHDPINIGNPNEISILELANLINDLTGNKAGIKVLPEERTESDPQRRKPDITLAKQKLGWQPKTSIEEGLEKTINYFKEQLAA